MFLAESEEFNFEDSKFDVSRINLMCLGNIQVELSRK